MKQVDKRFKKAIADETSAPKMYADLASSMKTEGFGKQEVKRIKAIIKQERKHKKTLQSIVKKHKGG